MIIRSEYLINLHPVNEFRDCIRIHQTPLQDSESLALSHHRTELCYCSSLNRFGIELQHARLDRSRSLQTSNIAARFSPNRILQQLHIHSECRINCFSGPGTQENPAMIPKNLRFGKDPNLVYKLTSSLEPKPAASIDNGGPISYQFGPYYNVGRRRFINFIP